MGKICSRCGVTFGVRYEVHVAGCEGTVHNNVQTCRFCGKMAYGPGMNNHVKNCSLNPDRQPLMMSSEARAKQAESMRSFTHTAEARRKISAAATGRSHTEETKRKLSKASSIQSTAFGVYTQVEFYYSINLNDEEHIVRGTWERDVADWLTAQGILWERNHLLQYTNDDGNSRSYNPDFYLPQLGVYIEVKGHYPAEARHKMELVLAQNEVKIYMFHEPHVKAVRSGSTYQELISS